MMQRRDLGGDWLLSVWRDGPSPILPEAEAIAERTIPAGVPGSVHVDLERAGVIPDPLIDRNELDVQWVGRTDWTLSRVLEWDGALPERVDLVFDGIDTVAEVEVDGGLVGASRNMHRSFRYDVTEACAEGSAAVDVRIASAYAEAEAIQRDLGARPSAYPEPFPFVRKMACSFGWDWGPTLATAGIWRPARLEGWSVARLASVRPLAEWVGSPLEGAGRVRLRLDVERAGSGEHRRLDIRVFVAEREVAELSLAPTACAADLDIDVPGVDPWWPRGYGAQSMYEVRVELVDAEIGDVLDDWCETTGFRRVEVDRGRDDPGSRFTIRVNDVPVFAKGFNWIPVDVFPGMATRGRYAALLREAVEVGANTIRVWGGGLYETDEFYDLCDEFGLVVWQDFAFACAAYPEDEPLWSEIEEEARENVIRLSRHPSLAVWCGCNENLWMRTDKAWADQPGGDLSWGEAYYLDLLPRIVAELDPSRPYTPGSPWSDSWRHDPNDPRRGTYHAWDAWNEVDYRHYLDSSPRFVSEFGWQGPATWRTLRDAVRDEPMTPTSPGVVHHQKGIGGHGKLDRWIEQHFGAVPRDVDRWLYLGHLTQARAVSVGVEHWRAHWPHTAGVLVWQLNDVWPAISWSAIDHAGRRKPLFFALRDVFAPRTLALSGSSIAASNDTDEPWRTALRISRLDADGRTVGEATTTLEVTPRSVRRVEIPANTFGDGAVLVAQAASGERIIRFDGDGPLGSVEALAFDAHAIDGGLEIRLTSSGVVRDVLVQADRIDPDAACDSGFFDMLPGETRTVVVRAPHPLDPRAAHAPWVVQHLWGAMAEWKDES